MKAGILSLLLIVFTLHGWSQSTKKVKDVRVTNTRAVYHGTVSPAKGKSVRATARVKKNAKKKQEALPPNFIGRGKTKVVRPELEHQGVDPLRQTRFPRKSGIFVEPLVNTDGLSNNFGSPHDPTGAVGLNHYVQAINATSIGVFDKSGEFQSSFTGNSLWVPLGESSLGDPIILYAHESDQWIITEFADPALLLIAVSETSDPLGNYDVYSFATPQFPDYPKYAIWDDFIVVTSNESGPGSLHQYFIDKPALLAGEAVVDIQRVEIVGNSSTEAGFYVTTPVHWNGTLLPEDNNPIAVKINDSSWGEVSEDMVEVFTFDIDLENSENTTVTKTEIITTPFDSYPCDNESGGFACLSQGEGAGGLDAIPEVIMNIPHYRNFETHESIVLNFVTDVTDGDNLAGIRWMELRRTTGNDWSLYQEGTFAPDDGLHRYMGSIAIDASGNIGMAYAVSGPTTFAGLRFTGRYAEDTPGEMTVTEGVVVDGANSISTDRFGDYPHMTVDPVDGQTFWFTAEYGGDGDDNSLTRILAFQLEKKDFDLAVVEISSPESYGSFGTSEQVVATIQNVGNLTAEDFDIVLYLDESEIESFNYSGALESGANYEHTFSNTIDLSEFDEYEVTVQIQYEPDEAESNDTRSKTVKSLAGVDAGLDLLVTESICLDEVEALITITNQGANTLTSLEIESFIGESSQGTVNWTGSLDTNESEEFGITFTGLEPGNNNLTVEVVSANGTTDEVDTNDQANGSLDYNEGLDQVTFTLTTDNYPDETLWILTDVDGQVLYSGGPYDNVGVYNEIFCLETDQCYIFLIGDTFGDGICCVEGEGSYELTDAEGNVIFESDGQFETTEETPFCIGNPPQVNAQVDLNDIDGTVCTPDLISQVQIRNLGQETLTSIDISIEVNSNVILATTWEGNLEFTESDFVQFTYSGLSEGENTVFVTATNPNGQEDDDPSNNTDTESIYLETDTESENLSLRITFDDYPDETQWTLEDEEEEILFSGGPYEAGTSQIIESLCVPKDGCYTLTFSDAFDDGMCCEYGDGSYSLLNGLGGILVNSNGQFGSSESNSVCLGEACNLSIEVTKTNVLGDDLGTIMITASGGTSYEYSVDNGISFQSSNIFNNLEAGEYSVVVKDESGCVVESAITLETECELSFTVTTMGTAGTVGTGSIEIVAIDGLGYEFSIDGGETFKSSNVFQNVASGEYDIVVRSNDGECMEGLTVFVDFVLGTVDVNKTLVVSPNPSGGLFEISLEGHHYLDEYLNLQVFDINGKLIQERRIGRYDDAFQGVISLYAYPDGIYFLKASNSKLEEMVRIVKK